MNLTGGTVVKLPKLPGHDYNESNETVRTLAEKTRHLRLFALKTAPEAFASSYEDEVQRDLTHALGRLKNPQAQHFFAVDRAIETRSEADDESFFAKVLQADFVGSIVLVGPIAEAEFTAKKDPLLVAGDAGNSTKGRKPLNYVLNGTFVHPEARRAGFGRALIEAALATGQKEAFDHGVDFLCTVLVDSENGGARKLYEKTGFSASGEESYVQRPRVRMGESRAEERIAIQLQIRRPFPNS